METRGLVSARWMALLALALAVSSVGAWAIEPTDSPSYLQSKAFFAPELYISNSVEPLEAVLHQLPNQAAWAAFGAGGGGLESFAAVDSVGGLGSMAVYIDARSGTASNLIGSFPVIPGTGVGNHLKMESLSGALGAQVANVGRDSVKAAVRQFLEANKDILGIDMSQLGELEAQQVSPDLWQVSGRQTYQGLGVRHGRLAATINHGNIVVVGTEIWGNVKNLRAQASVNGPAAVAAAFAHIGGRLAVDTIVKQPTLEVVPVAVEGAPVGHGYGHRLVWTFTFNREPEAEVWEVTVDATSGEVLALEDTNHYAAEQIKGGVYPLTSTEICPNPDTCGILQTGWPMPFADTGLSGGAAFTNSGGYVNNPGTGSLTTTLSGQYVNIVDNCGSVVNSGTGGIDLGGVNGQHDCTTAGGSAGNTASSRSAFYELTKLNELARGWLPSNTWLQGTINSEVNINNTCNAFYSTTIGDVNFYRAGGGCRNTGELAGVFDHEWGHALDDNDANGSLSNTSEAYADIVALYRLHTSCVGHGFWWTSNRGCGNTADGTGFNANEAQTGAAHCDTDCSGVRDADWAKHSDNTPDTALGFVCGSCTASSGPCGRQVHCAAAPPRQAAWDLVTRDLTASPFNLNNETAFILGNKLFYQGSGNVSLWYSCTCGSSSNGCGSTNGYMQWLAADDDNGNLADGTPHMTAIFNAFDRHGIACSTPTPTNSGCATGPTAVPNLSATPGLNQVALSWNSVSGASEYWVFRTEGVAGCDFGKARIAQVTGTNYTDSTVAGGRDYHYNVVAAGSSSACFSGASTCQTVTPTAPTPPPPPPPPTCGGSGDSCTQNSDCCSNKCKGKPGSKTCN